MQRHAILALVFILSVNAKISHEAESGRMQTDEHKEVAAAEALAAPEDTNPADRAPHEVEKKTVTALTAAFEAPETQDTNAMPEKMGKGSDKVAQRILEIEHAGAKEQQKQKIQGFNKKEKEDLSAWLTKLIADVTKEQEELEEIDPASEELKETKRLANAELDAKLINTKWMLDQIKTTSSRDAELLDAKLGTVAQRIAKMKEAEEAAAHTKEAAAPTNQEKRYDSDNELYTRGEFIDEYGVNEEGVLEEWEAAEPYVPKVASTTDMEYAKAVKKGAQKAL